MVLFGHVGDRRRGVPPVPGHEPPPNKARAPLVVPWWGEILQNFFVVFSSNGVAKVDIVRVVDHLVEIGPLQRLAAVLGTEHLGVMCCSRRL